MWSSYEQFDYFDDIKTIFYKFALDSKIQKDYF